MMTANVWKMENPWISGNWFGGEKKKSWREVPTEEEVSEKQDNQAAEAQKGCGIKGTKNLRDKE